MVPPTTEVHAAVAVGAAVGTGTVMMFVGMGMRVTSAGAGAARLFFVKRGLLVWDLIILWLLCLCFVLFEVMRG